MRASKHGNPTVGNLSDNENPVKRTREESLSPETPNNQRKRQNMGSNAEILGAIEAMRKDFSSRFEDLNQKLEKFEKSMDCWHREKQEIKQKQNELEARLDRLERQEKRTNIIVTGLPGVNGTAAEVRTAVNDLFVNKLKCDVKVAEAFQIKTKGGGCKIIAKLHSSDDKRVIMMAKRSLPERVYISDDLIPKDQFVQFKAREFMKKLRGEGRDVKIGNGKVFVDGKALWWSEETQSFMERKN